MSILLALLQIVGCLIISAVCAIIGSVCFMFLFFNLLFVIMKLRSITSSHPSKTLSNGCSNMTNGKNHKYQINYHQCVIDPFFNIILRYCARNHTARLIQESEHNYENGYCQSDNQSINGTIPEIVDNPSKDEVAVHTDNLPKENNDVNHKQTEPRSFPLIFFVATLSL